MRMAARGVPTPMVSPSDISTHPMSASARATDATRAGGTAPSYGQPSTQET